MLKGLEVFIGGDASELKKTLREADYAVKGFVNQNKFALKNLEKLGAPASVAFAGLTVAIGAAVKKYGDFEGTLNRVAAVSGASAAEIDALKAKAAELGAETKFSGQQAAEGMEELAKAGFNAQQTMDAIPGVMQLAAAGGVAVAESADLAGGTLRAFNMAMDESGRVADVMAQTANSSAVDIADIGLSMKYAGGAASAANQSLEETTAAIAIMGNAMVKGEQAGTTLRSAFVRLQDPPKECADALATLKISIADAQGKMRPLGDILQQLREKTAKLTDVQRNAAISQIFGTEALSGMLALVKASPAEYDAMVKAMQNADGAARRMSDTINGGLNGALGQLGASAESAGVAVGENLAPSILGAANVVKGAIDVFNGFDPATKAVATGAIAAGTAFTGLAGAAGLLLPVLTSVRAALFVTGKVGLTPVGLAVIGLTAAVGLGVAAFKAYSDANKTATTAAGQTADSLRKQQGEIATLTGKIDALKSKTSLTAGEQKELADALGRLQKLAPGVVTGYDSMGKATSYSRDRLFDMNAELRTQIELLDQAANSARQKGIADRDGAKMMLFQAEQELDAKRAELRDALRKSTGGAGGLEPIDPAYQGRAGLERVKQLQQEAKVLDDVRASRERYAMQADQAFRARFGGTGGSTPPKPKTTTTTGGGTGGGSTNTSGKSDAEKAAEKAADERHDKLVKQLGDIDKAFDDSIQHHVMNWGEGTAKEASLIREKVAEIKSKGLDKIPEGAEAVHQAFMRLDQIAGQNAVAKNAKDAADAKEFEERAIQNVVEAVKAQMATDEAAAKQKADDAKAAIEGLEAYQKGVRDLTGDIVAFAADPSVERMANFAKSLVSDESKLKSYGNAIQGVVAEFQKAGGGADGLEASLGSLVGSFNPLTIAAALMVGGISAIANAFKEAAAAADDLRQSTADTAVDLARLRAENSGDPLQVAAASRTAADKALNDELVAEMNRRKADEKKTRFMEGATEGFTRVNGSIDAKTLDDYADLKAKQEEGLKKNQRAYEAAVKDAGDAAAEAVTKSSEALEDALKKTVTVAEDLETKSKRLKDVGDELDLGGRDDYGNRISLESERDNAVRAAQTAYDEKRTKALDQQKKLKEDILKLTEDETKAIATIQNEGIAVRAKSESQDKAERIQVVKDEAQAKRDAKQEEIDGIEDQVKKEKEATEKAISNIQILASERITALSDEKTRLEDITKELERQLSVQQALYAMRAAQNAISLAFGAMGATIGVHAAGGTPVPPGGERLGTFKPGEFVLTPPQMNNLLDAAAGGREMPAILRALDARGSAPQLTAAQAAGAGGVSVGDINIRIEAGAGSDPRAIADAVWGNISARLRRAGLGR